MKIAIEYLKEIIIIGLVIFILINKGCNKRHTDSLVKDIATYSDSAKHYKIKSGVAVATNGVLKLDNENQLKYLIVKNDTIKKLLAQFKDVKTVIIHDGGFKFTHDTVRLTDTIPCDFNPIAFSQKKKHYKLFGTLTRTNLIIDTLVVPNTQTIVLGDKKSGFLNLGKTTSVDILNSNPYMQVNKISAYTVKETKWLENWKVQIGIGFATGFLVGRL